MSLSFSDTEKEYVIIVNRQELLDRAKKIGYQSVTLFARSDFDDEEKEYIKSFGKSIVIITYNPDNSREAGVMSYGRISDTEIYRVTIELAGLEYEEGKIVKSIDDALEQFPEVETLEKRLRNLAIIDETDYTDRCGNCHSYLRKSDKYCKYCGTERGKGKFLPFKNHTYCVYGPPVKKKYKCTHCGHLWITGQLGGDNSKYCPQCGNSVINVLEDKALWDAMYGAASIGYDEPYDHGDKPILLTEDQIDGLLAQREDVAGNIEDYLFLDWDKVLEAMRKVGIDIPSDADYDNYPRTEKEGEQINLANTILKLKGSNSKGCKGKKCNHCGSKSLAVLEYLVRGKNYRTIAVNVHNPVDEDALIYSTEETIDYKEPGSLDIDCPAYKCLSCGCEFGKLVLPKEKIERAYIADLAKLKMETIVNDATKLSKKALGVAKDFGTLAKTATKKKFKGFD